MSKERKQDPRSAALAGTAATAGKTDKPEFMPDIPEWAKHTPTLNAFFTVTELDGQKRVLPTLTLWVEDFGVKAVIADRATKRKLWMRAQSLTELWDLLENALRDPQTRWTDDTGARPKRSS